MRIKKERIERGYPPHTLRETGRHMNTVTAVKCFQLRQYCTFNCLVQCQVARASKMSTTVAYVTSVVYLSSSVQLAEPCQQVDPE